MKENTYNYALNVNAPQRNEMYLEQVSTNSTASYVLFKFPFNIYCVSLSLIGTSSNPFGNSPPSVELKQLNGSSGMLITYSPIPDVLISVVFKLLITHEYDGCIT